MITYFYLILKVAILFVYISSIFFPGVLKTRDITKPQLLSFMEVRLVIRFRKGVKYNVCSMLLSYHGPTHASFKYCCLLFATLLPSKCERHTSIAPKGKIIDRLF